MTLRQIDSLNIAFILLSAAAAFVLPFEVFLFSYAVLGPLHYLTEITWLKEKQFFTTGKYDAWLLSGFALWMFFGMYVVKDLNWLNPVVTASAFVAAGVMSLAKTKASKLISLLIAAIGMLLFWNAGWFVILFALFLTTIIHVFLFTAAFMLQGALKGRSRLGYLSVILFGACALSFFVWQPGSIQQTSAYALQVYDKTFFGLNLSLSSLFGMSQLKTLPDIFFSTTGLSVMRFIAFAYTYHYLNWFSKTSIIGWGEASKPYWRFILPTWIASVGIYIYDYQIGVAVLYFLSVLHVFLEFPLNHRSFVGIGSELKSSLFYS